MRDSEFAMARLASNKANVRAKGEEEEQKGWWFDFGRDRDGKKFEKEFQRILQQKDEKDDTGA
jgi:hypothetical protein